MRINHRLLRRLITGLALALVLAGAFWLGTIVGEIRGSTRALSGPPSVERPWTTWPWFLGHRWSGRHGALGVIESVDGDTLTVRGRWGDTVRVRWTAQTMILKGRDRVQPSALQDQVWIVVIGSPREDGVIDARVIQILTADTLRWPRPGGMHRWPPEGFPLPMDRPKMSVYGDGSPAANLY